MKKLLFLILLCTALGNTEAQNIKPCDSCKVSLFEHVKSIELQKKTLEDSIKKLNTGLDTLLVTPNYSYFYNENDTKFSHLSWLIVIVPLVFLIGILIWVKIKLSDFNLRRALSEIKIINNNKEEIESSSRLLAFLSGVVALILSVTLILVSLYVYLETGLVPDFSHLVNVVLALGIGVVPYTVNRIAGAFKANNT